MTESYEVSALRDSLYPHQSETARKFISENFVTWKGKSSLSPRWGDESSDVPRLKVRLGLPAWLVYKQLVTGNSYPHLEHACAVKASGEELHIRQSWVDCLVPEGKFSYAQVSSLARTPESVRHEYKNREFNGVVLTAHTHPPHYVATPSFSDLGSVYQYGLPVLILPLQDWDNGLRIASLMVPFDRKTAGNLSSLRDRLDLSRLSNMEEDRRLKALQLYFYTITTLMELSLLQIDFEEKLRHISEHSRIVVSNILSNSSVPYTFHKLSGVDIASLRSLYNDVRNLYPSRPVSSVLLYVALLKNGNLGKNTIFTLVPPPNL